MTQTLLEKAVHLVPKKVVPTSSKRCSTSTILNDAAPHRRYFFQPALVPTISRISAFGRESEGVFVCSKILCCFTAKNLSQVVLQTISPHLSAAKAILVSVIWALKLESRYINITLAIVQRAVEVAATISTLIETASETPQLLKNIAQLEEWATSLDIWSE